MSLLGSFNQQLLNLSTNLSKLYPEDPDLEFTNNSISILKKTNPRKLQQMFDHYVGKYKEQIINKDASFFLLKDFIKDDLNLELNESNVDYAESIIYNLKKYWNDIDNESKENIWKYLQVLIILNEKC